MSYKPKKKWVLTVYGMIAKTHHGFNGTEMTECEKCGLVMNAKELNATIEDLVLFGVLCGKCKEERGAA